jgi:hypothetical protein
MTTHTHIRLNTREPWIIGAPELPLAQPLPALLEQIGQLPPLTACVGLSRMGQPLLLQLTSPRRAHALIRGGQRAGKTTLLETLVASLAIGNRQSRLQFALLDPRGTGFGGPFARLPHLLGDVARRAPTMRSTLGRVVSEMEWRLANDRDAPAIVVAIDDIDVLASQKFNLAPVWDLIERGAGAGIHVVATASDPQLTQNHRMPNPAQAFPVLLESTDAGIPGEFSVPVKGVAVVFQVCPLPAEDWSAAVQRPATAEAGAARPARGLPGHGRRAR